MSADRPVVRRPAAGCSVTFHDLSVSVKAASSSSSPTSSPATRPILSSASGHIRGGSFCALLGCSGAGKTTLLSCLAGRQHPNNGAVLVNNRTATPDWYATHAAYVAQQSILLPALTPRESIHFASHMKLPRGTAESEHVANVERIVGALGLVRCADSQIGDVIVGGLSGGEKRRTNVAVELVNTPALLLLDGQTNTQDTDTQREQALHPH